MPKQFSNLAVLTRRERLNREPDVGVSPRLLMHLLHRRITFMTLSAIVSEVLLAGTRQRPLVVASWNIHSFNLSFHIPWFHAFMQAADISYCDGSGILKAVQ